MTISAEKKKSLNSALAKINKTFGPGTVKLVGEHLEELSIKKEETPSLEINEALAGGFARGRVIELYGENSCGKTSLALQTVAYKQKQDPEFVAGFFETEESYDPEYAKMLGVDLDRFFYWDQREHGAEKGLDILNALVNSGQINMIIVNSVAGLSPQKEREGEMGDQNMALTARMMSKLFRVITGAAAKNDCTLIFINQLRATMNQYSPTATSGGKALAFYASQRIYMSKYKIQAEDPIKPEEGIKITCRVDKNRYAKGNPYKTCTYYALFGQGIDRIIAIPDIVEREGIFRKAGSWFYWEDSNGKPLTVAGVECKFQSKNKFIEALKTNDEFREIVQKAISDKILEGTTIGTSASAEEIAKIQEEEEKVKKEIKAVDSDAEVAAE